MAKDEPSLKGDSDVVLRVIRKHDADFEQRGFQFAELALGGSVELGFFPVIIFKNESAGITMRIVFSPAVNGLNGGFSVAIIKANQGRLNVQDFMNIRGRAATTKNFRYHDPHTNLTLFTEYFLDNLFELFDSELKSVVNGKEFEETPIDWQGNK